MALLVKNLPANVGDVRVQRLIPGLGRSPGRGNDNPLQYSPLGIPWTAEPGGLQSMELQKHQTQLKDFTTAKLQETGNIANDSCP